MVRKDMIDPNEEPDWFKDFMASDSDQLNIPSVSSEDSDKEAPIMDEELQQMLQEVFNDEPVSDEPEEPSMEEPAQPAESVAQVQENTEPSPTGPVRKVRPKKKGGYGLFGLPHIAATAIWIVLAIGIGISLGRFLWKCATDVLAFGREDQTIYVTITDNDNIDTITDKLYNAGLIDYPGLFRLYAKLSNADESISSGTFKLNRLYDYHALVGGMSATSSYRESVKVVIPEGYSCAQIFTLLEEKGVCTVAKLEEYAKNSEFADYWFLEGVTRGHKYTLEGFLFPDTYEFYTNATPKQVFIKFLDRFEDQLDEEMEERITELNQRLAEKMRKNGCTQEYIDEHMLTMYDVITIASMIEKESAHTGEHYDVSSVIFNRLGNPKGFPNLQIDATIVYALGKKNLTEDDLKLDSPYNTYLNPGLPPSPISNPGKSTILAALRPADTLYYYYALDPSVNEHHFSQSYKEHTDFLASLKK